MQLFVYITKKEDSIRPLVDKLVNKGLKGGTIVDCNGMLSVLDDESELNIEDLNISSIFGSIRQLIEPELVKHQMLLMVLKDEDVKTVKDCVHEVVGNLKEKSAGILFTVPITNWEGVSHKEVR